MTLLNLQALQALQAHEADESDEAGQADQADPEAPEAPEAPALQALGMAVMAVMAVMAGMLGMLGTTGRPRRSWGHPAGRVCPARPGPSRRQGILPLEPSRSGCHTQAALPWRGSQPMKKGAASRQPPPHNTSIHRDAG